MPQPPAPNANAIAPATAHSVAGLVTTAPGAVVSRALAKGPSGTLTVFAFAAGQGLSEHSAPFDAYVQVLTGEATLTIDGSPVIARAGDLVLMPANVPHAVHAVAEFKMLLVMFKEPK
ncbi:MAG: cupin domain-containing protein [Polyangiaceae bacterium]|nr:cupin domain-containing protein [Polyangiaceae bacterium]